MLLLYKDSHKPFGSTQPHLNKASEQDLRITLHVFTDF